MTCRGYQYELNKKFILDGQLEMCYNGFHFCKEIENCFEYYNFTNGERMFEIKASGETITKDDKTVTDEIIFIKELSREEIYVIFSDPKFGNRGINNIGNNNKGNNNIGYGNIGNNNIGNYNYGNYNVGSNNTGNNNIGYWNVGNTGDNKDNNK